MVNASTIGVRIARGIADNKGRLQIFYANLDVSMRNKNGNRLPRTGRYNLCVGKTGSSKKWPQTNNHNNWVPQINNKPLREEKDHMTQFFQLPDYLTRL